jgi:aspartyl-tRNA synthetase
VNTSVSPISPAILLTGAESIRDVILFPQLRNA